ncbi:MAG TPA: hypothetical protein VFS84_15085 [Candidatus Binatia bacterium]|nr:hypothetical protein [Candidatus Binatia bacterium]
MKWVIMWDGFVLKAIEEGRQQLVERFLQVKLFGLGKTCYISPQPFLSRPERTSAN